MRWLILVAATAIGVRAQTAVDLRNQSRNVDFSGAVSTRPAKSGTVLPAICGVGELFYKTDAAAGANVYGCTSTNIWSSEGSGSGGGGASIAGQLGDFSVTLTGGMLSVAAVCSNSTPCRARFGNVTYTYFNGATVSVTGGSGLAFIYLSSLGTLTVGHNLTLSCVSGCVAQSGVTAFPPDAIPLFTWSATGGAWDTNGGLDQRAFLSLKNTSAGTGLISAETSGKTVFSLDTAFSGQRTTPPSTSTSACDVGSWAADTSFYYVCVAQSSWRRVAVTSW